MRALLSAILLLTTVLAPVAAAEPADCAASAAKLLPEPRWPWECDTGAGTVLTVSNEGRDRASVAWNNTIDLDGDGRPNRASCSVSGFNGTHGDPDFDLRCGAGAASCATSKNITLPSGDPDFDLRCDSGGSDSSASARNGTYSLNVDARDNGGRLANVTFEVDAQGPIVALTIDEPGAHGAAGVRCDTSGDAPKCFPIWAGLSQIPTAGIVFTNGDEKGASAGVLLFANGAVVGCFAFVPAPGSGAPSAGCFP